MQQPTGIDWKHTTFIIGTRADHRPDPIPQPACARVCEECGDQAYTEIDYPLDVPVLCNVCAARITIPLELDSNTQVVFDMPNDLKARFIDIAHHKRVPIEVVVKDFMQWNIGRPTKAAFYDQSEQKKPPD